MRRFDHSMAACGIVGVDMDVGAPGISYGTYCINIPSAP